MGNVPLSPGIDYRLARTIVKYKLPMKKIQVLWRLFNKYDKDRSGYITADDFFDRIIRYKQTCLTDKMFQVVESESDNLLSFGEFVELVTAFACFGKEDLVNYFFYAMDLNKTGRIGKSELKSFIHGMWSNESSQEGLCFLESMESGRGNFNFKQVHHMQQHNPVVLYPLYDLQTHIRKHTLGDWWSNIITHQEDQNGVFSDLKKSNKESFKAHEGLSEDMVKQRMGTARYYLLPWQRSLVKDRLLRTVAVDTVTPSARSTARSSDPDLIAASLSVTRNQVPFS